MRLGAGRNLTVVVTALLMNWRRRRVKEAAEVTWQGHVGHLVYVTAASCSPFSFSDEQWTPLHTDACDWLIIITYYYNKNLGWKATYTTTTYFLGQTVENADIVARGHFAVVFSNRCIIIPLWILSVLTVYCICCRYCCCCCCCCKQIGFTVSVEWSSSASYMTWCIVKRTAPVVWCYFVPMSNSDVNPCTCDLVLDNNAHSCD